MPAKSGGNSGFVKCREPNSNLYFPHEHQSSIFRIQAADKGCNESSSISYCLSCERRVH